MSAANVTSQDPAVMKMLNSLLLLRMMGLGFTHAEAEGFIKNNLLSPGANAPIAYSTFRRLLAAKVSSQVSQIGQTAANPKAAMKANASQLKAKAEQGTANTQNASFILMEMQEYTRALTEVSRDTNTTVSALTTAAGTAGGAAAGAAIGSVAGPLGTVGGAIVGALFGSGTALSLFDQMVNTALGGLFGEPKRKAGNLQLFNKLLETTLDS